MTSRAILRRMHVPSLLQMSADQFLIPLFTAVGGSQILLRLARLSGHIRVKLIAVQVLGTPVQIGDLIQWTKRLLRMSVTIEAKTHAQRLSMIHHRHFVDLPVTLHATDTAIHMSRVVEIRVLRKLVNLNPPNRLP